MQTSFSKQQPGHRHQFLPSYLYGHEPNLGQYQVIAVQWQPTHCRSCSRNLPSVRVSIANFIKINHRSQTFVGIVVSNLLDDSANDFLVVQIGLGGDFTENHNHASFARGFTSNFTELILRQASVQNGIRDLIADLVYRKSEDTGNHGEKGGNFYLGVLRQRILK